MRINFLNNFYFYVDFRNYFKFLKVEKNVVWIIPSSLRGFRIFYYNICYIIFNNFYLFLIIPHSKRRAFEYCLENP